MVQVSAEAKSRVEWVDFAKGICIFFVVMLHVNDFVQERTHQMGWLEHVVTFARPFRMPDFFLIAGLFLSNAMRRPWRHYIDRKVVHFLYFYLLWMTVEFAVLDLPHLIHSVGWLGIVLTYLRRFVDPAGSLWFIHILPVFFLVTRLTRSVPRWAIWIGAAVLHSLPIATGWHVPDQFAQRFVYFYSGYVLAPHVFRLSAWVYARVPVALGALVGWGIVNGLVVAAGWAALPIVSLALGYAGAFAVIITAVMLSKLAWAWPLRDLGRNSIIVYLGDVGVSLIVVRLLQPLLSDVGTLALVSSLMTVLGTLVLWQVAIRTPARFLYQRPAWLTLAAAPRVAPPAFADMVRAAA
jgi:uncharacterized membrane protein YcfT